MHLNPSLLALLPRSAVSVPCPVIRAGAKLFCLRMAPSFSVYGFLVFRKPVSFCLRIVIGRDVMDRDDRM
jgi:hypothetical protein